MGGGASEPVLPAPTTMLSRCSPNSRLARVHLTRPNHSIPHRAGDVSREGRQGVPQPPQRGSLAAVSTWAPSIGRGQISRNPILYSPEIHISTHLGTCKRHRVRKGVSAGL